MTGLDIRGGRKAWAGRAVLDGIDLAIRAGERLVILGPSGAGKSTLLSILGGLERLDGGTFLVGGRDFAAFSAREQDSYRNRQVGFVFQRHCLLPQYSLFENILVPVLEGGAARTAACARAREWIARAGLEHRASALPAEVSVGESQRAAILRALINRPAVLLADEPTGSLDTATAGATMDFLLELQAREGSALVLVTHDHGIARQAAGAAGRMLTLADGILHGPD